MFLPERTSDHQEKTSYLRERADRRREKAFRTSFPSVPASGSPLACPPGSKHIDDLPDEILILVFDKGCELDWKIGVEIESVVNLRRRYPLVSFARGVCIRWKHIIDDNSRFCKEHFWFIFLQLSPPFMPSIHQFVQFNQALAESQDCNLHIKFNLPWNQKVENLSKFTRVIETLIPYQKQITSFRIDVSQPQFLGHLLEHLSRTFAIKLDNMSRCLSSAFTNSGSISSVSFVGHDPYQNGSFHDFSQMNGKQMKFPFLITHLEIPELSLRKNYGFFDAIRNELISLTVSSSNGHGPYVTWAITLQPSLDTIHFSKLRYLCMSDPSSGSGWAIHFFKNVSCPRLEFAKITGIKKPLVLSLSDAFDPTTRISEFPHLQELTVEEIDISQHSLSCLAHLASPSVRKLRIGSLSFHGCENSGQLRITDVLRGVFRHMQPLEISLKRLYQRKISLLEVFNFSTVRKLTIGVKHRNTTLLSFSGPGKIKAPLLSKLEICAEYFYHLTVLEPFECVSLTTLNLSIHEAHNGNQIKDITRFFTTALGPRGKSKFPNLQNLHLIMRTRSMESNELIQIFDELSARRHLNGATLLVLHQIDSRQIWTVPYPESDRLLVEILRLLCWEHVMILRATSVGDTQYQPKQSRQLVLTDEDFNLVDQIDFNDAYRIAQYDPNHWSPAY